MTEIQMEYNSQRPQMIIPEYGRNIQKMIEHAVSLEDREERNKAAQTIIDIMGQLHPHLRDVNEFKHKLWAHMFIISKHKLDVDSPFPIPEPEKDKKPERLQYPVHKIKYKHYGRSIEKMIKKAREYEEGEMKEALKETIANLMKKAYLSWNRDSVNDKVILDHLKELSDGELVPREDFTLDHTNEILSKTKKRKKSKGPSRPSKGSGHPKRKK